MRCGPIWFSCFVLLALAQTEDLTALSQRGKQAMLEGRYAEAADIYRKLVKVLPEETGLHLNLGMALQSSGKYTDAIPQFAFVTRKQPNQMAGWLLLGLAYQKLGDAQKALAPLMKAQKLDPANPAVLLEVGDAHLTLARNAFRQIEAVAPGSVYQIALLARSQAEQGQFRNAFGLYRKADGVYGVHRALAEVYRQTGHADWAQVEAGKERKPECATSPMACLFEKGNLAGLLEEAAKRNGPEALYWASLAHSELARQALAKLAELPASAEQHQLVAEGYRRAGRRAEAIREWREALKLSPDDVRLQSGLAKTLWENNDYDEAEAILRHLVERDARNPEWQYELGDLLFRQSKAEEARPHLEKAVAGDPSLLPAHAVLGRVLLQLEDPAAAIPHLERGAALDSDGSLHFQLATAYRRAGKTELAEQALTAQQEIRAQNEARRQSMRDEEITPP